MSEEVKETAIAKPAAINMGKYGIEIATMEDAFRFSKAVSASGFAPKGMDKPESILIAIQHGMELGLKPLQALQSIAVVNGRPAIYGDSALAIVRASGELEAFSETVDGDGDKMVATCTVKRKGFDTITSTFSVGDAKTAALWGKPGPWIQYPRRMLQFRARGFALRDSFGDYLRGLKTVEEMQDYPRKMRDVTPMDGGEQE